MIAMTDKRYNVLFLCTGISARSMSLQNRLKDIGKTADQGSTIG